MPTLRVLLCTGQEAILEVLTRILRDDGCEILPVSSTAEALDKALQFGPNVLIIETIMPGVDGLRAAQRIVRETGCKALFLEPLHDIFSEDGLTEYANGLRREVPGCDVLPIPFSRDHALAVVHSKVTGWSIAEKLRQS